MEQEINAVDLDPWLNNCLVGSVDGTVSYVQLATKKKLWSQKIHGGTIVALAINTDGTYALTASADGSINYLYLRTGNILFTIKTSSNESIKQMAINPRGTYAVIGRAHTWEYINLHTGAVIHTLYSAQEIEQIGLNNEHMYIMKNDFLKIKYFDIIDDRIKQITPELLMAQRNIGSYLP